MNNHSRWKISTYNYRPPPPFGAFRVSPRLSVQYSLLYWLGVNVLIQEVLFVDKPLLVGKATTVQRELQISNRYRQALVFFSIIVMIDIVSSLESSSDTIAGSFPAFQSEMGLVTRLAIHDTLGASENY